MEPVTQKIKRPSGSRGFTLVEILIVLLLIGIATMMIAANLSPDDRQSVQIEADRLAILLEHAAEEARATGREMAFSSDGNFFGFWEKNEEWTEIRRDDLYHPRPFQSKVRLTEMRIDRNPVPIHEKLIFHASGINSPFEIVLSLRQSRARIQSDPLNRVTVENESAEAK